METVYFLNFVNTPFGTNKNFKKSKANAKIRGVYSAVDLLLEMTINQLLLSFCRYNTSNESMSPIVFNIVI